MAAPRFVQAKKTTLASSVSEGETGEIVLRNLLDIYGVQLSMSDFGAILYLTLDPGGSTEEIISCTGFTVNADGSVSIDTGIVRGLLAKSPYTTGGTPQPHANGNTVVVSDQPQLYKAILDYIDGIAIAGAPDASQTSKGILEVATAAEINAGTATGSTGAPLAVTPDQLLTSIYNTRLPSANGIQFLNATTGMYSMYGGDTAPTGFLAIDGSAVSNDTYSDLLALWKGRFGYGTGATFTAVAATDVITASAHGLTNGNRVLVDSTTTLPAGLSRNTVYYVISATTNTFQLSLTSGGTTVNITDTGTGTHSFYKTFKLPDGRGRAFVGTGTGTKVATILSIAGNVLTVTGLTNAANNEFQTGQAVVFAATVLGNLVNGTTYYVVRVTNTTISLATSLANAQNGTLITLAGTETGTFTLTLTARAFGDTGGEEKHAMSATEQLAHTHGVPKVQNAPSQGDSVFISTSGPTGNTGGAYATTSTGGNAAMNSMMPFFVGGIWVVKT